MKSTPPRLNEPLEKALQANAETIRNLMEKCAGLKNKCATLEENYNREIKKRDARNQLEQAAVSMLSENLEKNFIGQCLDHG